MKIINNEAVDFIFALRRFGIRNMDKDLDYPGIIEIDNWCREYEKKLSPFLLNDISLLSEKSVLVTLYLFIKVHENSKVTTSEQFLSLINSISAENFKNDIINQLFQEEVDEINIETIYNAVLNDGLHPNHDVKEESELLFGVLNDPEYFLTRLKTTFTQFYNLVYLPNKDKFKKLHNEKYDWHVKKFNENPQEYLKALGLYSIVEECSSLEEISYYFSLFSDNEVSVLWDSKTIIIGGGTDVRVIQQSAKTKTDLFFSCLGDPKRLEILRLTSQRPWYSTELANHFNLKPATLSYHINKLVEADLLSIRKGEIKRFYYTLNKDSLETYLNFVSQDLLNKENMNK